MDIYMMAKHLHMTFAGLTLLLFLIRGYWMIVESDMLDKKLVKIVPHIVDTLLLVSAIVLVIETGFYPIKFDWVTLKILLLVAYIVLGTIALKRGKTKRARLISFALSIGCVLSIFAIAFAKPVIF